MILSCDSQTIIQLPVEENCNKNKNLNSLKTFYKVLKSAFQKILISKLTQNIIQDMF